MSTFSRGPWKAIGTAIHSDGAGLIATAALIQGDKASHNATLLAAAPRLLAALQWCEQQGMFRYSARTKGNKPFCDGADECRAAIADALGLD